MLSVVIFDCDGVLFDSCQANVAYYDAVRAALGLPRMSVEWEQQAHVLAASQVLEAMFGTDPALLARARAAAKDLSYAPFLRLMEPAPHLYDVLRTLKARYRLAMATNRGSTVPGVVAHFGLAQYLELAVGVRDVARPKPHPDLLEKCLAHFGVPAHAAVYVGDARSDLAAAEAAGVRFVAVNGRDWAPYSIDSLAELPACLQRLSATAQVQEKVASA